MATLFKRPSGSWKAVVRKTVWPMITKTFRIKRDAEDCVFLSACLHLLFIEGLAIAAIDGLQAQNVLSSEARDRAIKCGGAARTCADLPGYLRSQARIGRLVHEAKGLLDPLVGDQAEERRLFQLHRQALA